MTPLTAPGPAAPAGGGLPPAGLGLAVVLLIVTVIEQSRYSLGPLGRSRWMAAGASLAYGLAGWALSGRLVVGLVLAVLTLGVRVLLHRVIDPRPSTLWKGVAQTTCVHAVVASAWLVLVPQPAPWLLEAGAAAVAVVTGGAVPVDAAPVEAMIRAVVTVTAYVFVWGSGTVITRAALGLDDYLTGRRETKPAVHREAAAALDQEPMYRWGRLATWNASLSLPLRCTARWRPSASCWPPRASRASR